MKRLGAKSTQDHNWTLKLNLGRLDDSSVYTMTPAIETTVLTIPTA